MDKKLIDEIGEPKVRAVWSHSLENYSELLFEGYEIVTKGPIIFLIPINCHPVYGSPLTNFLDPYKVETYETRITKDSSTLNLMFTGAFNKKGKFKLHYPRDFPESKEVCLIMEYLFKYTPLFRKKFEKLSFKSSSNICNL